MSIAITKLRATAASLATCGALLAGGQTAPSAQAGFERSCAPSGLPVGVDLICAEVRTNYFWDGCEFFPGSADLHSCTWRIVTHVSGNVAHPTGGRIIGTTRFWLFPQEPPTSQSGGCSWGVGAGGCATSYAGELVTLHFSQDDCRTVQVSATGTTYALTPVAVPVLGSDVLYSTGAAFTETVRFCSGTEPEVV